MALRRYITAARQQREGIAHHLQGGKLLEQHSDVIIARNDTGATISAMYPAEITGVITKPWDDLAAFYGIPQQAMTVDEKLTNGQFLDGLAVIALEDIADGAIGRFAAAGVVPAIIDSSTDAADKHLGHWCEMGITGNQLVLNKGGSCQEIWREGGETTTTRALLRVGNNRSHCSFAALRAGEQTSVGGVVLEVGSEISGAGNDPQNFRFNTLDPFGVPTATNYGIECDKEGLYFAAMHCACYAPGALSNWKFEIRYSDVLTYIQSTTGSASVEMHPDEQPQPVSCSCFTRCPAGGRFEVQCGLGHKTIIDLHLHVIYLGPADPARFP